MSPQIKPVPALAVPTLMLLMWSADMAQLETSAAAVKVARNSFLIMNPHNRVSAHLIKNVGEDGLGPNH